MKPLCLAIAALAVTAGFLSPAEAQQRRERVVVYDRAVREPCSPNLVREFFWPSCSVKKRGTRASPHVYSGGTYAGQDPDPRLRAQLRRQQDLSGDGLP